jgi:hypothetical protein
MIKTTFEDLWKAGLEGDAKAFGVIDGDLLQIRNKVKNLFVSAGWTKPDGTTVFVSDMDCANALQAARTELNKSAPLVAATRKASTLQASSASATPTKSSVLSASHASSQPVALHSTGSELAAAFAPQLGRVGDRCPRCQGRMEPVKLVNAKAANYCTRDRVVVPLSDA